ncbi:hypothetical protein [Nocardia sp. NPDC057227]|uniref:hypothetical protein n=1 Tax=Nocardia sp. NPDC057227 TaxID=3346056 RepID=UPI0036334455
MPEPVPTREQATQLMRQVYGPDRRFSILESRQGWVCQEILPGDEVRRSGVGLGSVVINKHTGVITSHSSLPVRMTGEMFDTAIEAGNPAPGFQVYPKQHRIHLTQVSETENTIEYQVRQTDLDNPLNPELTRRVQITKEPIRHQPTDRLAAEATSWAYDQARRTGTWPQEGTFER